MIVHIGRQCVIEVRMEVVVEVEVLPFTTDQLTSVPIADIRPLSMVALLLEAEEEEAEEVAQTCQKWVAKVRGH